MQSRTMTRAMLPALVFALIGSIGVPEARAQEARQRVIPSDTVVRVSLDNTLSSRDARPGDTVSATVADRDRSGFPLGTRLEGTVTEAQRSGEGRPGVVDVRFDRAVLPGGRSLAIDGRLASLSDDDVRRTEDGRLESRRRSSGTSGRFEPKWVGYGAAGGAVLGTIFGSNLLKGALLGAAGGAVYSYLNRGKGHERYRDVELDRGTAFGVRLNQQVAFTGRDDYRYYTAANGRYDDDSRFDNRPADRDRLPENRNDRKQVLGSREEWRYGDMRVRLNGEDVPLTDARPLNLNGTVYVPLQPIADAAHLRYNHRLGDENFTLFARDGAVRGRAGDSSLSMPNDRSESLEASPVSINGEIYVPVEYLSRVAGMDVNWDRRNMRLDLDSAR